MTDNYLSIKQIGKTIGVTPRSLWRWVAQGAFPAPDLKVGGRIRRWRIETIEKWMASNK